VIRAAAHAFNHKGYHNTSLDDIAAALEVTKPTVYYYVSNKSSCCLNVSSRAFETDPRRLL